MEIKRWQSLRGTKVVDEMDLVCTDAEYEIIREFLKAAGVVVNASVYTFGGECKVYVRNPYKEAVEWYGDDRCKKDAADNMARYLRGC